MDVIITEISAEKTWDLRHRVMWPNKPLDYVKLPNDNEGIHYGLWKNKKLVSVVSLFIKNEDIQFRKLATEIPEQGNGYATKLLLHVMLLASNKKISRIWCNARTDKIKFYKKFGMKETNHKFSKENIDYVIVEKFF
jgi:predicted GNAT family N-acyltransferase